MIGSPRAIEHFQYDKVPKLNRFQASYNVTPKTMEKFFVGNYHFLPSQQKKHESKTDSSKPKTFKSLQ
jgi:hypothetical protein